ncbi:MAG: magnesium chelatase subunit D [Paracoccaceae bacterium]|nr:magnesium chelatase subunit D [Paracoccaceae bacterium]
MRPWDRACLALNLLAADPERLRGLTLRARAGPVRDTFLNAFGHLPQPLQKLHPAMPRDALLGGLDLSDTLATGQLTLRKGLLDQPGTLILAMAERCPPELAAILAATLDNRPDIALILLDEGSDADEHAPKTLTDRLAFHVTLDGIGRLEAKPPPLHRPGNILGEREGAKPLRLARPAQAGRKTSSVITVLTTLAHRLGIDTLRLPSLAVNAAWTHARLNGRDHPNDDDIEAAATLVLAPHARHLPEPEPPQKDDAKPQKEQKKAQEQSLPEDMLIDAVKAVLPPDLLENLRNSHTSRAQGSGAGQRKKGNRRGRPIPSRPGRLDGSQRLDLVATLRTAAPWQTLRGRTDGPLKVYPSDIRLKRYEEKSDRIVIFAVDASGSAALARLGEAKGAIELMLARAYAARDHVSLVAFRGDQADILLPPTRSLVQTKRRLAALPGGGGTPLAHGLKAATELALQSRAQGLSPTLALLTDGRANIALDGSANRARAAEDATQMARWVLTTGIGSVVLDLGARPQPALATLARDMGGTYLPLPRADAHRMSDALGQALDDGLGA